MATDQTTSTPRLADRLASARARRFVGRAEELALFGDALATPEPPFAVLFVSGPGGIGKSALLEAFGRVASEMGISAIALDARGIHPSPSGLLEGIASRAGLANPATLLDDLSARGRLVLLIDSYERLAPLDDWLRESFLPRLPSGSLVVVAGRDGPGRRWRDDAGWGDLLRHLPLRNLRPEESRAYLRIRQVPPEYQSDVLDFTHGHPLALSLVADVVAQAGDDEPARPVNDPDIVRALLDRFVADVPSPLHRQALQVASHARVTTEALLAEALSADQAATLFDWLRGLSFIEHGPEGIFPHDVAREALEADLHWRNPDEFRDIHLRVRRPIVERLREARGTEQQRAAFDLLFLHRASPIMRPYYDWTTLGSTWAEPLAPDTIPDVIAMTRRHEGDASAEIARYWIERQPAAFSVCRKAGGETIGFVCMLTLDTLADADRAADPAIDAAARFVATASPLRPGEVILHNRFTISRDAYQSRDALGIWEQVSMQSIVRWLSTPRLAWSFTAVCDAAQWQAYFAHLRLPHAPEAGFEIGGRHYGVFVHDWRAEPPVAWLDAMAEREIATTPLGRVELPAPPAVILSEPEFAQAVRQVLRNYRKPDVLASNPLLRSRLAIDYAEGQPTPETLRGLLRAAVADLEGDPRDVRLLRAIQHTYLTPAATQEQAAELLGLPFSTYRYHLTNAVDRVSGWLWQRELHGWPADPGSDSTPIQQ